MLVKDFCSSYFMTVPKCVLPGRFFSREAVPYIWYILPLMLIYRFDDIFGHIAK